MKILTYDYVKNFIENKGYTLLSDSYKNNKTHLLMICDNHHICKIRFDGFRDGRRCPVCSQKQKYDYDYVKNFIKLNGYLLLSDFYKNNKTKLQVKCPEGHIYGVTFSNFKNHNHRCPVCFNKLRSKKQKHDYNYVKIFIENEGYALLSNSYKNNSTKLQVKCPEGHIYDVKFNGFRDGRRCPVCWNESTSSKGEKEVINFVKSLGIDIVENDRTQIINPLTGYNLELDVWIPSIKKAIEYNGIYWHSHPNTKQRDKIKKDQCDKLNIDLLIISDDKWRKNNKITVKEIKCFLNINL